MSQTVTAEEQRTTLLKQYRQVRAFTEKLCEPLAIEDYVVQAIEDVSPPKWHLGHTTWFFEQVVLHQFVKDYTPYHERYYFLFNSYYNTFGERVFRPLRGTLSRPTVKEVYQYRHEIDSRMERFFETADEATFTEAAPIITLGLNHEQQHQELNLTDLKWNFGANPLLPAYRPLAAAAEGTKVPEPEYVAVEGGLCEVGHDGTGFAYDNETPRHKVY
ncbi:MAG: ergothioneine biosynthesis protein EgtB, partial [Candidatus Zixiibacteriota bacterium]